MGSFLRVGAMTRRFVSGIKKRACAYRLSQNILPVYVPLDLVMMAACSSVVERIRSCTCGRCLMEGSFEPWLVIQAASGLSASVQMASLLPAVAQIERCASGRLLLAS